MEKRTFNVVVSYRGEEKYIPNVSEEMILEYFRQWFESSYAEDFWSCFSHEIEYTDEGIPFEDENGEVFDE